MSNLTKRIFCLFLIFLSLSASVSPALAAITYTYDANGNMMSDGTQCYEYNEANQLAKVTNCASLTIAEYMYDYQGNRIAKKEFENGQLKHTIYSPDKEYEVKKPVAGSEEKTNYVFANNELVARKNPDGSRTYYQNDHLGSATLLTNQSGAVVENTTYFPFGDIRSGGTKSKYLYTGQERDQLIGLNYYNSRYYNSHIHHFTQPDTMLPDPYDPQQLNRYAYVRNNPLKYTDPSGHFIPALIAGWVLVETGMDLYSFGNSLGHFIMDPSNANRAQVLTDTVALLDLGGVAEFSARTIEYIATDTNQTKDLLGMAKGIGTIGLSTVANRQIGKAVSAAVSSRRAKQSKEFINAVWEEAMDENGRVFSWRDDGTPIELFWDKSKSRFNQWHMGHVYAEQKLIDAWLEDGLIDKETHYLMSHDRFNFKPEAPSINMKNNKKFPK